MSRIKYTTAEVADIVESEGLGYAIEHYLSAGRIADDDLSHHWRNAQTAMKEINRILKEWRSDEE